MSFKIRSGVTPQTEPSEVFEIALTNVKKSKTISDMLEETDDAISETVYVDKVMSTKTIWHVAAYLTHHTEPTDYRDEQNENTVWTNAMLNGMSSIELCLLLNAVDYLKIDDLKLCIFCKWIADIRDLDQKQILQHFDIKDELPQADKDEMERYIAESTAPKTLSYTRATEGDVDQH